MRKLAVSVIAAAIHDYQSAAGKLNDGIYISGAKEPNDYRRMLQAQRRECWEFLTSNSNWHQILEINPESIRRRLRRGPIEAPLSLA